jgi:tRNA-Thr(GGU) m(6)t(6)A37 methyltransferase TsaA
MTPAGSVGELRPIGVVRSPLRSLDEAPCQASKGAPPATLVIAETYADSLLGIERGQELIVLTWLHRADRNVQQVHPMDDLSLPLTGVFATRSSQRPNPIGVHPVTVTAVERLEIAVDALEAIDGTPIIDIKCRLG